MNNCGGSRKRINKVCFSVAYNFVQFMESFPIHVCSIYIIHGKNCTYSPRASGSYISVKKVLHINGNNYKGGMWTDKIHAYFKMLIQLTI